MSTSVSGLTDNFFPSAENGFTTTTSGSVSSGAATVGLNSVAGYSNGEVAVFVIDPTDASKKQTFTGVIDTGGVQVTNVTWTAGTNQAHALGATVVDYATATHISMMTKGIIQEHTQAGAHAPTLITARTADTTPASGDLLLTSDVSAGNALKKVTVAQLFANPPATAGSESATGWKAGALAAPNTVTYLGNRSYEMVYNGVDYTSLLSPGMRKKFTRTVTAPTQCTSLNGTTQYYSKTSPAGMTFTDDFVVSAWIKLSSYGAVSTIASRYNGTSGWSVYLSAAGLISVSGYNAGAANISSIQAYQSVPLNKWVHVTVQLDMSSFTNTATTSYVMMDGVDVPALVSRGGTNPTALIQAGNLEIGGQNGGALPFSGKIAQVAIYSAKVTQANIRATMSQGLSGSETSLISAYSFNNSINDLSANANNLTANGSAVATNADSPFSINSFGTATGTTDYGIITAATFSTNTTLTVQVPEGNTIPTSGGVSAVSYSTQKAPYGMPVASEKWRLESLLGANHTSGTVTNTFYTVQGLTLTIPIGAWKVGFSADGYSSGPAGGTAGTILAMSTTTTTVTDIRLQGRNTIGTGGTLTLGTLTTATTKESTANLTSATTYYVTQRTPFGSIGSQGVDAIGCYSYSELSLL